MTYHSRELEKEADLHYVEKLSLQNDFTLSDEENR